MLMRLVSYKRVDSPDGITLILDHVPRSLALGWTFPISPFPILPT